jgi:serine/threonine-protein kinase RsbW
MKRAPGNRTVHLEIASRFELLDVVETVLVRMAEPLGFEEDARVNMIVAVRESVVNAIKHAHRKDETKRVALTFTLKPRALEVEVRDEGPGFDPRTLTDPLAPENILRADGRGIFFMRQFMDEVRYSFPKSGGTIVRLVKRRS